MFYVREGQNDIRRSLQIIDKKLNGLPRFPPGSAFVSDQPSCRMFEWFMFRRDKMTSGDRFKSLTENSMDCEISCRPCLRIWPTLLPPVTWKKQLILCAWRSNEWPAWDPTSDLKPTICNALMSWVTTYLEDASAIITSLSFSVVVEFLYVACYCSTFIIAFAVVPYFA